MYRNDGLDNPFSTNSGNDGIRGLRRIAAECSVDVEISGSGPYRLEYATGEVCDSLDYCMAAQDIRAMAQC